GDHFEGGAGIDTVDYSQSAEGVSIDLSGQTAGGGDGAGDTFSGIENIIGSFHDDVLVGDAGDTVFRGGLGADIIIGGGGNDWADYTGSAYGVTVNLETGLGSGLDSDAEGDVLAGIYGLIGPAYGDTLIGDANGNRMRGGFGQDLLMGGAGSDDYEFGFDQYDDIITEIGNELDIDRLLLDAD